MQSKGATIVTNLRESAYTLSAIKASLQSRELICDSMHWTKIFSNVRSNLLEALKFMNQIARLDLTQLKNNGEQVAKVQSLADSVYEKLVKARIEYDKLDEDLIPNNERVQNQIDDLDYDFRNLLNLYSNQMHNFHSSFQKLNKPDISLLSLDANPQLLGRSLLNKHRELVLLALKEFTKAEDSTNTEAEENNNDTDLESSAEIFFPQFLSLSNELTDNVDLIYQDCNELILKDEFVAFDGQESPYLENFTREINQILEQEDILIGSKHILEAIQDDAPYSRLIEDLLDVATSKSQQIKLSELTKVLLTLQALRLKYQNLNSDPGFDINLKSIHTMNNLGVNDRSSSTESKNDQIALSRISRLTQNHLHKLNTIDPKERLESQKKSSAIQITKEAENIMQGTDLSIAIYKLKQELKTEGGLQSALSKPNSEISRLIKKYQVIFIKSGIDRESLINLDNTKLISIIQNITSDAMTYNSINLKAAAELIYILTRVFAIDMIKKI